MMRASFLRSLMADTYPLERRSLFITSLLGGLLLLLAACSITSPNISYDACLAGEAPCPEVCNGEDDDRDEAIDEGLDEVCIVSVGDPFELRTGGGRALAVTPDIDGDGLSDVLISNTRATEDLDPSAPEEGFVALYSGRTHARQWEVKTGGDFGASIVVGKFGSEEPLWCAGAPTREGSNGVGRVICLNFNQEVIKSYSSEGDWGLGHRLRIRATSQGEQILVSEPRWTEIVGDGMEMTNVGRVLALEFTSEALSVAYAWNGTAAEQRVGEVFEAVHDSNGDGVGDLLFTGFDVSREGREVWLVDGSLNKISRIQSLVIGENTQDRFGEAMAWGYFDVSNSNPHLAFGSSYVEADSMTSDLLSVGRVYFTDQIGQPLGTNSARPDPNGGSGYGSAMVSMTIEGRSYLIVAGAGRLRILKLNGGEVVVISEMSIPTGITPSLAGSNRLDGDGVYRFWLGMPELSQAQEFTLRPPTLDTPSPDAETNP